MAAVGRIRTEGFEAWISLSQILASVKVRVSSDADLSALQNEFNQLNSDSRDQFDGMRLLVNRYYAQVPTVEM